MNALKKIDHQIKAFNGQMEKLAKELVMCIQCQKTEC